MFKYLRWFSILIFKLFSKVFGLVWFYFVYHFRGYARNVVQNYVLENKLHLPRIYDRKPKLENGYYILEDVHNVGKNNNIPIKGRIKYRHISKLEFLLVFWFLWIWVDDDSNHDTMSGTNRISEGYVYGNTFDLGDVRAEYPQFDIKESTAWLIRNTAYNFNYYYEELAEDSPYQFYYKTKHRYFKIEWKQWYKIPYPSFSRSYWHFGFIPYSNPTRKGRMVWFWEDIQYIIQTLLNK